MASPTPVLPLVGSTMVPPGLSLPSRSAASTILMAIRSLTDPPGFMYSSLARTSGLAPSVTRESWIRGVLPTRSISEVTYCTRATVTWPRSAGAALQLIEEGLAQPAELDGRDRLVG